MNITMNDPCEIVVMAGGRTLLRQSFGGYLGPLEIQVQPQAYTGLDPEPDEPKPSQAQQTKERGVQGRFNTDRLPSTGKSLYAWLKGLEKQYAGEAWVKGLSFRVMGHFKKESYPADLGDWTPSHVAEACRYVDTIRHALDESKPAKTAKPRQSKPAPITYDEQGVRVTPLMMSEQVTDAEHADGVAKLLALATASGCSEYTYGEALMRGAVADGKAPYLDGMGIDLTEMARQYALLKKHFPEWLQPNTRMLVQQFRAGGLPR